MTFSRAIRKAADIVLCGGVVAYPTEAVFGFGCVPEDPAAVDRILQIKRRSVSKGLLVIVSRAEQVAHWIDADLNKVSLESSADSPITWIVPATDSVPMWIRGDHAGVAVRVTKHPVAKALCEASDSPLVSTSANVADRPPTRSPFVLRRNFGRLVDYVVPGRCGPAGAPSEIRELVSGRVLRAG